MQKLATYAKSHGFKVTENSDHIVIHIPYAHSDETCDEICRNWIEVRNALGY